jgi:hypothetical protein
MFSFLSADRFALHRNSVLLAAWLGFSAWASGQSPIAVVSSQGQTTVTWNGKQVYAAPTRGDVLARRFTVAGQEFALAYDGGAVIWRNHPDAAAKLKEARASGAPTRVSSQGNLVCQTIEGIVRVRWNGKQVYSGSVTSPVVGKSAPVGGVAYAAAYDGNKVIWESAPGAASKLR